MLGEAGAAGGESLHWAACVYVRRGNGMMSYTLCLTPHLAGQVRATALAAYTNAGAPLHAVMQALNRTQHEPLFQVRAALALICHDWP